MEELIMAQYKGIKCDNPKCGWADWNVNQSQYKDYINKSCPICGQNLLTEECYRKTEIMLKRIDKLNRFLNKLFPATFRKKMLKKKSVAIYDITKNGDLIPINNQKIDVKV